MDDRHERASEMNRLLTAIFADERLSDRDWLKAFALVLQDDERGGAVIETSIVLAC